MSFVLIFKFHGNFQPGSAYFDIMEQPAAIDFTPNISKTN